MSSASIPRVAADEPDTLPMRPGPAGELRARFVVADPGSYDLKLVGYPSQPPDDPHAVHDPATGNWLSVRLVNVVTGEKCRPVAGPELHYSPTPARRSQLT